MDRKWIVGTGIALMLILLLSARWIPGDIRHVETNLGVCEDYSEQEIMAAVRCVERYFLWHFSGCTLERISYDESASRGITAEAGQDDAVVLWMDFIPGARSAPFWTPGSRQTGFRCTLIRDSLGVWHIVPGQMGYG